MPTFKKYNLRSLYILPTIKLFTALKILGIRWNGNQDPLVYQMAKWTWTAQNHFIVGYNERSNQTIVVELGNNIQMQRYYQNGNLDNLVDIEWFDVNTFIYWVNQGK
jgi:hypothetical protein